MWNNMEVIKYDDLIKLPPEKRLREPSGDLLNDKISGILVGFAYKLIQRDNHIDRLTVKDAQKEIRNLIKEYMMYESTIQG